MAPIENIGNYKKISMNKNLIVTVNSHLMDNFPSTFLTLRFYYLFFKPTCDAYIALVILKFHLYSVMYICRLEKHTCSQCVPYRLRRFYSSAFEVFFFFLEIQSVRCFELRNILTSQNDPLQVHFFMCQK